MRKILFAAALVAAVGVVPARAEVPVVLRGSPASMERQNRVARELGLTFVRTPSELRELVRKGELVPLRGNADYELADFVSYPQARPEVRLFIERLAAQYHAATGERLVVTSLTRPASRQPGNSHELSVHPTGIAVDLRVSTRKASRAWLEDTLLSLEGTGLLDVTRERNPPHYHVALFPEAYVEYVSVLLEREAAEAAAEEAPPERMADLAGVSLLTAAESPAETSEEPAIPTIVLILAVPAAALALFGLRR